MSHDHQPARSPNWLHRWPGGPGVGRGRGGAEQRPRPSRPRRRTCSEGGQAIPVIGQPSTLLGLHAPGPAVGVGARQHVAGSVAGHAQRGRGACDGVDDVGDARRGRRRPPGRPRLPLAGLVEVTIEPLPSTATQRIVDGHDTALSCAFSTSPSVQAGAPPWGSVECNSVPLASTTTHSVVAGTGHAGQRVPVGDVGRRPRRGAAGRIGGREHGAARVGGDAQGPSTGRQREQRASPDPLRPTSTRSARRPDRWSRRTFPGRVHRDAQRRRGAGDRTQRVAGVDGRRRPAGSDRSRWPWNAGRSPLASTA